MNLITNLCFKLKIRKAAQRISAVTEQMRAGEVATGMNEEQFSEWFRGEFLGAQVKECGETPRTEQNAKIRVKAATWNVGNKQPRAAEFNLVEAGGGGFDLIVIGTQECTYTVKEEAVDKIYDIWGKQRCGLHNWFGIINSHLGEEYGIVECDSLLEMRLVIFAKRSAANLIANVQKITEATGIAGVVGNKGKERLEGAVLIALIDSGGVLIRLEYGSTSLAFINSHLAAHEGASYTLCPWH